MKSNFIDNSAKFQKEFDEKITDALELIGLEAEGYAKEDCPVDTGLLRNSMTYAVSGERTAIGSYKADRPRKGKSEVEEGAYSGTAGAKNEATVYIGTNVKYAKKVEYGDNIKHTSGKAHFLRDAVTNHSDEYKKIVKQVLKGDHV